MTKDEDAMTTQASKLPKNERQQQCSLRPLTNKELVSGQTLTGETDGKSAVGIESRLRVLPQCLPPNT